MSSDRGVYARPIEITDDNDDVDIGGSPYQIYNGAHPHIGTVLYSLEQALPSSYSVVLDTDFKVVISNTSTFAVTWTDDDLRRLLGYIGNLSGSSSYTAVYTPENTWFPYRVRADRNRLTCDHRTSWTGKESGDGNVPGFKTGDDIYRFEHEYEYEPSYSLLESAHRPEPEQKRSLDFFLRNSRGVWPQESANSGYNMSGFYYYPDYTDLQPMDVATLESTDDPLRWENSPNNCGFFQFDENYDASRRLRDSLPRDRQFYNIRLDMHTATPPSWPTIT